MALYQVTVDKLNQRRSPVTDASDKSNVVGVVTKGFTFESTGQVVNALGTWYLGTDGFSYWGGGVVPVNSVNIPAAPTAATATTVASGNDWWIDALNLPAIWSNYNELGANAKIAVLDSGYDVSNNDIQSGVKDSRVFYTAVAGKAATINDTFGHGTHCTSLIGGRNTKLVTGCAPQSQLYSAKICSQGSIRSWSVMTDAIRWAVSAGVDVISISYGGDAPDPDLSSAITVAAQNNNILVVAAIGDTVAGSTNAPCYPALFPNCLAVGATNAQNAISSVTIMNAKTEINAPGENITGYGLNGQAVVMSGTSQATAIVAGIAALMISRLKALKKSYNISEITGLITQNTDIVAGNPDLKIISPQKIFDKL